MSINTFVEKMNNIMRAARKPITFVPAALMACSVFKRPGMSPSMISANIIKRQSEFGAPTGLNEDGTRNMVNSLITVMVEEITKGIKMDSVTQIVIPKGTMFITGTGANAGGPVEVVCTNPVDISGYGITR